MPAPPTLFLDFDGVLHPNLADPGQLFKQAPLLADALDGHALQIVVSRQSAAKVQAGRVAGATS